MITIQDLYNDVIYTYASKTFGGGERHVKLDEITGFSDGKVKIIFNYENDGELMELALLKNALENMGIQANLLEIPYFPGARQDRICDKGEAFSLKVYANFINSLNFPQVTIFDPHSDVTPALVNNVDVVNNHVFIENCLFYLMDEEGLEDVSLVSPDAGSNKKIFGLAKELVTHLITFQITEVIRCDKLRDMTTGKIIESIVYADDLTGKDLVICDDVASYSNTFMLLAEKLKQKGAHRIFLAVSHFEGVADLEKMRKSGIDAVFTTTSKNWEREGYNTDNYIVTLPWRY
jgi:ribose-phosphate pyrophosphokinase